MDDCTSGCNTEKEAIELAEQIRYILQQSGVELSKWKSNSKNLVKKLAGDSAASVLFAQEEKTSVLGLKWLPKSDEFTFEIIQNEDNSILTKRRILSTIYQLYDPNGLVAPVITTAKLLVQLLWKRAYNWDDPVSNELEKQWKMIW